MKIFNPEFKPHHQLGETDADWDALKAIITNYLANAAQVEVEVDDLRALDAKFSDDVLWRQIVGDLALMPVPEPPPPENPP